MVCIYCRGRTRVINSRHQRRTNQTWRRRQCQLCKAIFTSLEGADLPSSLSFRTSQNKLNPFSRDLLFISIYDSLRHRPSALTDSAALTATVISKLLANIHQGVIDRRIVVTTAGQILKRFDRAAATYYQAYHRQ